MYIILKSLADNRKHFVHHIIQLWRTVSGG